MAHILWTNDDGIQAPGLRALLEALRPLGRVSVFAPDHNWSAAGHTKTMHKPLRVARFALPGIEGDEVEAYTLSLIHISEPTRPY